MNNLIKTLRQLFFVCIFLPFYGQMLSQTDSLSHSLPVKDNAVNNVSDDTDKKPLIQKLFMRFNTGISLDRSTYTSELITAASSGINITDTYLGKGFAIPAGLVFGIQIHQFKIGVGFSAISFHVPSLLRTGDTLQNTYITGNPVKHQNGYWRTDYMFPLFLEYTFYNKNHFELSVNTMLGVYYHDINSYDGWYAGSARAGISGNSYGFGVSPQWNCGHFTFFLNPSILLNQISYHRSTRDDLSDIFLSMGLGCCISL